MEPAISTTAANLDERMRLAVEHHRAGRLRQAEEIYRQILADSPDYAPAIHHLGVLAVDAGRHDLAVGLIRRAVAIAPNVPEAHSNLGIALAALGQFDEAVAALHTAISLKPSVPEVHFNLGTVFAKQDALKEAIAAYRKAIELNPAYAEAWNNLGNALKNDGQLDEAVASLRHAISLHPTNAEAHSNLGNALKDQGRLEEARLALERAVELKPHDPTFLSNLLFALQYHRGYSAEMIDREQRRWNDRHAKPLAASIQPHANSRDPQRRLRVGYVSPDFRDHVVGRNVLPLVRERDHAHFEIFCYANHPEKPGDPLTERFRAGADCWRNIVALSDEQTAGQIRSDGIDILVDLALHTAHNRLPIFARKPAPVQVTFAGYPGATGLQTIDYRLTDSHLDPPGGEENVLFEKPIRLPDSFWCYDAESNALGLDREPKAGPLPALANGYVTLGCLNHFSKINAPMLEIWAEVLKLLPTSRLLLSTHPGSHRESTTDHFRSQGIDPTRIDFVVPSPRAIYLEQYHRIDIALDTIPYNGHTTSLDALWMGVPVVTRAGQTIVGRAGLSQLTNLGVGEWVARSEREYVEIIAALASDRSRLAEFRSTLRARMLASPLTDAKRFARAIESAYRRMWENWCETAA